MGWIYLENIEIHAPVGVSEEERERGNNLLITVGVKLNFSKAEQTDDLHDTLDYEEVYTSVKDILSSPYLLLEKAANDILEEILEKNRAIKVIRLKLSKLNPPISGKCEKASVVLKKRRK